MMMQIKGAIKKWGGVINLVIVGMTVNAIPFACVGVIDNKEAITILATGIALTTTAYLIKSKI